MYGGQGPNGASRPAVRPAVEVDRATGSLITVIQAVTTAGIWFAIVWLPILLAIGLLAAAVVFVLRRLGVIQRPEPTPATPAG